MRKIIRSALFTSAFSPILLVFGIILYAKVGFALESVSTFIAFILLSFIGWLIILGVEKQGEALRVQIKKFESNDSFIVPFLFSYSTPAFLRFFDLEIGLIGKITLALFIIGMVLSYFPIHPVLRCLGYRFYKCETDAGSVITIIVKRDVRKKETFKSVVRITENLFIERNEI